MSAINETEPGGEMVSILDFNARPRNAEGQPITGKRRLFSIGERVRYIKHIFVNEPSDNPLGYVAIFKALDPNDENYYGATAGYFVTLDCWEALKKHFASNLMVTERGGVKHPKKNSYVLIELKDESTKKVGHRSVRTRNSLKEDR